MKSKTESISIKLLGEFRVLKGGLEVSLPPSKKTRALLAFLAVTGRPHRRERLCDMFWSEADDPRATLRWSLSKIRSLINHSENEPLYADRERVALVLDDINIDVTTLAKKLDNSSLNSLSLQSILKQLQEHYLDGLDLPDEEPFQQWLNAERLALNKLQANVLKRLLLMPQIDIPQRLQWAKQWHTLEPFSTAAASQLISELNLQNNAPELAKTINTLLERFRNAGIAWSPNTSQTVVAAQEDDNVQQRELLTQQKIAFCQASDGVRLAYASVGNGPPIIKAANWLSHLEHDWQAPIWSPLFRELAKDHQFIRYDERGNGLSDWDVEHINFESFVTDLETVVEASNIEKFSLLGISQGAAVSIEYAVRHPERVAHLILFGGYDTGWRLNASEHTIREREAIMTLTESGWGQDNPAYRHIFSSTFMPSANPAELAWFNEFQRLTTSSKNAARFLSVFGDIDVREQLAKVTVPTLVIHSLGDCRIPVEVARNLAESIPNAKFKGLDSDGHLLLGREPASTEFVNAVKDFISNN